MLSLLRKNWQCANGSPNSNWKQKERKFLEDLATGDHLRTKAFPVLTEKDANRENKKRFGKNQAKWRSISHYQEKSDKSAWNNQRKDVARNSWDMILDNKPSKSWNSIYGDGTKPAKTDSNDAATKSDSSSGNDSDSTTASATSKDLQGQNSN